AFLVRRLERDATARGQLARYALIGAALRGELLQPHPWVLQHRIDAALNGVPAAAQPPVVRAARQRGWRAVGMTRPLAGAGIAAAAAVAAIGLLRYTNEDSAVPIAQPSGAMFRTASQWQEPESYVVPQEAAPRAAPADLPIRLTNYLVYHGQYASHLSRTSVHSNVVGVVGSDVVLGEESPAVVPAAAEETPR